MRQGYDEAKHLLNHYLKNVWAEAGLKWGSDNQVEVDAIIDSIQEGVQKQIEEALQKKAL